MYTRIFLAKTQEKHLKKHQSSLLIKEQTKKDSQLESIPFL